MILTSSRAQTLRSHFKYLKIHGTVEAEQSMIVIKSSCGLDVCIMVVDRQLLIAYGNAGDRLEFTLKKNISLLASVFHDHIQDLQLGDRELKVKPPL
jgi:hypothetical protein